MKEDLRVPTVAMPAEILLEGGEKLTGQVFLPSLASRHSGRPRPDEWINQATGFFPFLPDGQQRALILNKSTVNAISLAVTPDLSLDGASTGFTSRVRVQWAESLIEGTLLIDMPERTRVLDYLNGSDRFIPLWSASAYHLIRKSCITTIAEMEEI